MKLQTLSSGSVLFFGQNTARTVLRASEDDRQLGVETDAGHVLGVTLQCLNTRLVLVK